MMSEGPKTPRRDTRFKKGQSGNPNGRPRKPRRTPTPNQMRRDILKVRDLKVPVKTAEGEKTLTLSEAVYFNIAKQALRDRISWARTWLQIERAALQEEYEGEKSVRLMELLRQIIWEVGSKRDELTEKTLDAMLEQWSRKL